MNTNDLNARSSLTKRQRRSHVPRVECLESREVLSYPALGVQYLINQALFHHRNTAFQTIAGVNNSLRADLAGPLAGLATNVTHATANAFETSVWMVVASYEQGATAQLSPRFPWVYSQIVSHAQSILNGVVYFNGLYQTSSISSTNFFQSVSYIVTH